MTSHHLEPEARAFADATAEPPYVHQMTPEQAFCAP